MTCTTPDVLVRCSGQPGHGSLFLPNTTGEKLLRVINSFLSFRDKEERRMKDNPDLPLGHVTTVNLTMLEVRDSSSTDLASSKAKLFFSLCGKPYRKGLCTHSLTLTP